MLPVVLLGRLELARRAFDRTYRARPEARETDARLDAQIAHVHVVVDGPDEMVEACCKHEPAEILGIRGPAEALAAHDGVEANLVGKPTARVDVGKVQLAARLEHAMHL